MPTIEVSPSVLSSTTELQPCCSESAEISSCMGYHDNLSLLSFSRDSDLQEERANQDEGWSLARSTPSTQVV